MVESIYFLKPAWCGTHRAGLWPEQDFQSVTVATAFRRWFSLAAPRAIFALAGVDEDRPFRAVQQNSERLVDIGLCRS
jgi:hypothetical protein